MSLPYCPHVLFVWGAERTTRWCYATTSRYVSAWLSSFHIDFPHYLGLNDCKQQLIAGFRQVSPHVPTDYCAVSASNSTGFELACISPGNIFLATAETAKSRLLGFCFFTSCGHVKICSSSQITASDFANGKFPELELRLGLRDRDEQQKSPIASIDMAFKSWRDFSLFIARHGNHRTSLDRW